MERMRGLCGLAVALIGAAALPGAAAAEEAPLGIELNKLESFEAGCRSFFLFRNRAEVAFDSFEMALAILDRGGVIDRLITLEAAPLPAQRTTLKLFEIPDIACEAIGTVLLHDITACTAATGPTGDCFAMVELTSLAPAPLVK
jgi:hypothetical protein